MADVRTRPVPDPRFDKMWAELSRWAVLRGFELRIKPSGNVDVYFSRRVKARREKERRAL